MLWKRLRIILLTWRWSSPSCPNSISRDISELSAFCWPMRGMLLTLKVTEGLQGLQAITWSGLWESTHIPEAELVLPPSSGEGKQPVGRVNLLSPTLSPHQPHSLRKVRRWKLMDSSSVNLPQIILKFITPRIFCCLQKRSEKKVLYICISSERSECKDAGTAALQEKARFPYLMRGV